MSSALLITLILMIICMAALIVVKVYVSKRLESIDGAEGIAPEVEIEQDQIENQT